MYAEFELDIPDSLDGALGIMAAGAAKGVTPLAGGTNLIVDMRAGRERPTRVVGLGKIDELRGISCDGDRVSLGGCTTVADLLHSPEIAAAGPSLVEAARLFAGQMVRNTATVGGNIACGSPAADLVPPLLSLDAEVTLTNGSKARSVSLDEYFLGYKQDLREQDELITCVSWRRPPERSANAFYKLARRKGDAITVTGVAVTLSVAGERCARARIALGAVAPVVMRAKRAEALLEGETLDSAPIDAAARQAAEECQPIDDVRASAGYRRHAVEALVRRLLTQARDRLA